MSLNNPMIINDMRPYTMFLKTLGQFFRAGEDIVIFEIGVRRGISTRAFLEGVCSRFEGKINSHVYGCDVTDRNNAIRISELREKWTFIHGHSQEIKWDKAIDILFIDGEHTEKAVREDYNRFEPFVKPGGMIILHDMKEGCADSAKFWPSIEYPKFLLDLNRQGLGLVQKPK